MDLREYKTIRATHTEFRDVAVARMRQHVDLVLPSLYQDEHDEKVWLVALDVALARVLKEFSTAHMSLFIQMEREQDSPST